MGFTDWVLNKIDDVMGAPEEFRSEKKSKEGGNFIIGVGLAVVVSIVVLAIAGPVLGAVAGIVAGVGYFIGGRKN